jgi:hypothetical protein
LPKAPVATPPIIRNPTPRQTQAAARQISSSITRIVGSSGSGRERLARREALLREVRTDPRYARERASLGHWAREQAKLITPDAQRRMVTDRVRPGPQPTRVRLGVGPLTLGTVNLTATSRALGELAVKVAPGLKQNAPSGRLFKNALGDLGALGSFPFVGGYTAGHAIVHDVSQMVQHPTSWSNRPSESGKLLSGIAKGIAHEVTHPGESFSQHPILTALDAAGAVSLGGRLAGAASRRMGRSSTVRPPLAMMDDAGQPAIVQRTYSKDETRRQVQKHEDSKREPMRDANGKVVTVKDRGQDVPVLKSTASEKEKFARQRGDFIASRGNMQERRVRDQATKVSRVIGVKGKAARNIVAMAVEGTLTSARHFASDLRAHRDRIAARIQEHESGARTYTHSGDYEAAKNRLRLVDKVLSNPKAMAQGPRIIAEAERHGANLNAGDAANAAAKIIDPLAARRSALSVPALEHMGARHFSVEEHQALEADARKAEQAATEAYHAAKSPADRQAALAALDVAREHRIAVSGREPTGVRAHENAKTAHVVAKQRAKAAHDAEAAAQRRVQALAAQHKVERGRDAHHGPVAAYYVGPHRFALRQDAIAFAKLKGTPLREIKRIATTAGESKRVGELSNARRALKAATDRRRGADKALKSAARGVKDNPLPETEAALRYGERSRGLGFAKHPGEFLSNEDIEDFLHSRGRNPDTVAYLPHREDIIGARAHHAQMRPGQRPVLDSGPTRTGEAYLNGVTEASVRLLHDQGVRQVVQLNKAKQLDKMVQDHGLRHPAWAKAQRGEPLTKGEQRVVDKGGGFTEAEATEVSRRAFNDTGERLTPMRMYNAGLSRETQRIIREDFQGPGGMETLQQHLLDDRIVKPSSKPDTRTRNVALVPSDLVERLQAHARAAGHVEKFFQWLNKPFRMAVLPQPRWLTGNFVEAQLVRLPTVGSGLVNIPGLAVDVTAAIKGLKALEQMGPEGKAAAEAIRAQQTTSGLFIGGRGAGVHRTTGEALPEFAARRYGRLVSKLPVVDQATQLVRSAAHWITMPLQMFFEFNRVGIENPAQIAGFGHNFRQDIQAITGSWIKSILLQDQAVKDAAAGYVHTAAQERAMHAQYELLGQYAGYSPALRALVQSVAPFLPWALNSARFAYWTMPIHNTVKTALLVKTAEIVQKDWEEIHKNTPPGSLKNAIPNGKGGWIDLQRYTPYSLTAPIAQGGDLRGIAQEFTPQFSGFAEALGGKDPFGRDLKVQPNKGNPTGKPSTGQDFLIALYSFLESTTPYLSTARRLREHGETAYGDSTVASPKTKPNTGHGMSAAERTFSPFRPTYLRGTGGPVAAPKRKPQRQAVSSAPADPWDAVDQASSSAAQSTGPDPWQAVK